MKKQLKELTIKDNFMFGAVMTMPENCKDFLEMVLQTKLSEVVVSKEKSMIYHQSIRESVWMSMQMMKNEPTIMWKCRFPKSRHLGEEADIIKVRLIWSCWYLGKSMKNFRILMLFFYVTLTRLGRRNIDTHFQVSAKNVKKANCRMDDVPFF